MSSVFFGLANRSFQYERTLGRGAQAGSGFSYATDLALGPNGLVYVVNRGSEYRPDGVRIGVMTMDEEYITEFSRFGSGDGELTWPTCIALDSNQNVYVTDEALDRLRHAGTEEAVREAAARFQRALYEDPPAIFLASRSGARAVSRRFEVPTGADQDIVETIWQWRPANQDHTE